MMCAVDQGHTAALAQLGLPLTPSTTSVRCPRKCSCMLASREFLRDRSQVVHVGEMESDSLPLPFGVPQWSVPGPKRFIEYTPRLSVLAAWFAAPFFADDMKGFTIGIPSDIPEVATVVEECTSDVKFVVRF